MNAVVDIKKGLEGVVVDSTSISLVDGEAGRLYYRGLPIEKLVHYPFAAVAHLVVFGDLPDAARLEKFEDFLWERRTIASGACRLYREAGATPGSSHGDPAGRNAFDGFLAAREGVGRTDDEQEALVAAGAIAHRARPAAGTARRTNTLLIPRLAAMANVSCNWCMAAVLRQRQTHIFEQTQILQIDHSFNASTFTARVVTSTLSPPASALAAAMGSLYGPLHGAADQGALEMAEEVGDPRERRTSWPQL